MKLLAIDTCTEACSAAFYDGSQILSRFEVSPREHGRLILPMIDELLAEGQSTLSALDAIAFTRGPGAFTGVRIGTGVVKGLAYAADLPVISISSLATLAQGNRSSADYIATAIDARMGEIYFAIYRNTEIVQLLGEETVVRPENAPFLQKGSIYGLGTGWLSYGDSLSDQAGHDLIGYEGQQYPHAENAAKIALIFYKKGKMSSAADVSPVYLRNRITE